MVYAKFLRTFVNMRQTAYFEKLRNALVKLAQVRDADGTESHQLTVTEAYSVAIVASSGAP